MERYRKIFTLAVWTAAAIFGATRPAGHKARILVLIEALMVLITAFVALKTIDLIFKTKKADDNDRKNGRTHLASHALRPPNKGTA